MEDYVTAVWHLILTISALLMQCLPVVTKLLGLFVLILQAMYWLRKWKEGK
jgi:hypothetical protein